jgi:hypothetical protein
MSSVAGQSVAIGNLGKVGGNQVYAQMNFKKLYMFVERYLELSSELKYRKGESGAFMQLGELMTQKGDYDSSVGHFYRAMQIADQIEDSETRETAKVNFGMANASMKWDEHVKDILIKVNENADGNGHAEDEEEMAEKADEEDELDNLQ